MFINKWYGCSIRADLYQRHSNDKSCAALYALEERKSRKNVDSAHVACFSCFSFQIQQIKKIGKRSSTNVSASSWHCFKVALGFWTMSKCFTETRGSWTWTWQSSGHCTYLQEKKYTAYNRSHITCPTPSWSKLVWALKCTASKHLLMTPDGKDRLLVRPHADKKFSKLAGLRLVSEKTDSFKGHQMTALCDSPKSWAKRLETQCQELRPGNLYAGRGPSKENIREINSRKGYRMLQMYKTRENIFLTFLIRWYRILTLHKTKPFPEQMHLLNCSICGSWQNVPFGCAYTTVLPLSGRKMNSWTNKAVFFTMSSEEQEQQYVLTRNIPRKLRDCE